VQFALGAAVTPLVSISGETTALPLAMIMATFALLASAAFLSARSRDAATPLGPRTRAADEKAGA
jgi:hypothetical protein